MTDLKAMYANKVNDNLKESRRLLLKVQEAMLDMKKLPEGAWQALSDAIDMQDKASEELETFLAVGAAYEMGRADMKRELSVDNEQGVQ